MPDNHLLRRKSSVSLLYSLLILIFSPTFVLAQSCYFTSGLVAPTFTACNGTASVSHCCSPGDACLTSGLCYGTNDHSINVGTCTDQNWRDSSCFQLCPKNTAYKTSVTNTLYRCNDNNWCCSTGGNATSCCNDPGIENFFFNVGQADISNGSAWAPGLTLVPIAAVQTSLPTSSISAQSCPTQTVLKEVNGTTGSDGETQGEMDYSGETQTVGLAVGLGISVPLLIALSAALFLLWREKRSHQMLRQQLSGELVQPVNAVSGYGRKEPYEIYTRDGQAVKEMPTEGEMIPELQSNLFGR